MHGRFRIKNPNEQVCVLEVEMTLGEWREVLGDIPTQHLGGFNDPTARLHTAIGQMVRLGDRAVSEEFATDGWNPYTSTEKQESA